MEDDINLEEVLSDDFDHGYGYSEELDPDDPLAVLTDEERALYEKLKQKVLEANDPIMDFYKQLEEKPSDEQIEAWKEQAGDVYFAHISERENFVFRAIKRLEWRELQKRLEPIKDPLKRDEALVMKAVLYPPLSNLKINALSAGTVDTLRDLIVQASNFLPPEYAFQLVRKL